MQEVKVSKRQTCSKYTFATVIMMLMSITRTMKLLLLQEAQQRGCGCEYSPSIWSAVKSICGEGNTEEGDCSGPPRRGAAPDGPLVGAVGYPDRQDLTDRLSNKAASKTVSLLRDGFK